MSEAMSELKSQLRKQVRARVRGMSTEFRQRASYDACELLLNLHEVRNAGTLMIYLSIGNEIDVNHAIGHLLDRGRVIGVPRVDWKRCAMEPIQLDSLESKALMMNERGVRVPKTGRLISTDSLEAVVVPGLVFDLSGQRLGRGAGYYDRFLSQLKPSAIKIGIAFAEQLVDKVPAENHDVSMDIIVTNEQVFYANPMDPRC